MQVEEVATCVNVYRGAIEPYEFMNYVSREAGNQWSEIQWSASAVGVGSVSSYRTSSEANISHLERSQSALAQLFAPISSRILDDVLLDYKNEHLVATSGYEGWRLLRYSGGAEYHSHYDHAPQNQRIISVVAFLESPTEGGHLEFPFFNVKIEPVAGDVVVFPSNFPYVHIAHPVTAGIKCSLVTWLQ